MRLRPVLPSMGMRLGDIKVDFKLRLEIWCTVIFIRICWFEFETWIRSESKIRFQSFIFPLVVMSTVQNVSKKSLENALLLMMKEPTWTLYPKELLKKWKMTLMELSRKSHDYHKLSHDLFWYRFIECIHCKRQFHKICVLYHEAIWSEGYQCDNCLRALLSKRRENKFVAKRKNEGMDGHRNKWTDGL